MAKKTTAWADLLTPKQQRFVSEHLKDHNGTQAAIRTGHSERKAKQQGSRLLTDLRVLAAVQAGQKTVARKAEVTVERLTAELEQARKLALKCPSHCSTTGAEIECPSWFTAIQCSIWRIWK